MIPPILCRRVLPFVVLVLAWAGWAVAQDATSKAPTGNPRPEIRFDSQKHDFGVVEDGVILKHVFPFRNVGQATLIIQSVKAG